MEVFIKLLRYILREENVPFFESVTVNIIGTVDEIIIEEYHVFESF